MLLCVTPVWLPRRLQVPKQRPWSKLLITKETEERFLHLPILAWLNALAVQVSMTCFKHMAANRPLSSQTKQHGYASNVAQRIQESSAKTVDNAMTLVTHALTVGMKSTLMKMLNSVLNAVIRYQNKQKWDRRFILFFL